MMSFPTLTRRGRSKTSHFKQTSFDVSEIAAAGRWNSAASDMPSPSGRALPLTPLKKLTQFFRRQISEQSLVTSNQSISSLSTHSEIFGRSLSDICTPEPPKPITDLLVFLQEVGPFTREIFRKPPNAKSCRALSEKLNAVGFYWEVEESCNGLLLASVLKTFLREIPNKLCDDRMFNQWSAIFQGNSKLNDEQRVTSIKRLIAKLPKSNQLILKELTCVLYRIHMRSADNLMNSYNLSVCLGPCLLWTKSTSCREVEKASKTVPKLVQFIIERCVEIFGRDILLPVLPNESSLARNTSLSLDSVFTDKPNRFIDSCSSIDVLTNLLGRQQMSPSRLSYDSGMILDDMSHDEELPVETRTSKRINTRRFNSSYDSLGSDVCISDDDIQPLTSRLNNNTSCSLYVNTLELPKLPGSKPMDTVDGQSIPTSGPIKPDLYQTKITKAVATAGKRNTVQIGSHRCVRPSVLPGPAVRRTPSVLYDNITYRYISDSNMSKTTAPPTTDKFYSLPRPARNIRPSIHTPKDSEHTLHHSVQRAHRVPRTNQTISQQSGENLLTSITCPPTQWKPTEVPIVVIDGTTKPNKPATYKLNYQRKPESLRVPEPIYENTKATFSQRFNVNIPIYENSELYGASGTLNRRQRVEIPVHVYENLPFSRQPPITRQRRRTLNTGVDYTTNYKQPIYNHKNTLKHRHSVNIGSKAASPNPQRIERKLHNFPNPQQLQHETCYFV